MQIHVKGTPITGVDEWLRLAPPKGGERHWQDGHSAKELARAWFSRPGFPTVPAELRHLLDAYPSTHGAVIQEGTPEHRVHIDRLRGEQCNLDLTLLAHGKIGRIAITVEAKATETFGSGVQAALARAERLRSQGRPSHGVQRVHNLVAALFGRHEALVPALRYQLLTAAGGALAYGHEQHAKIALLIVHELTAATTTRNAEDLGKFVAALTEGRHTTLGAGEMIGPIALPGAPIIPTPIPLFVGKIRRGPA